MQVKDVIIAGAGPAGLVCAVKLAQAGFSVTVFEAEAAIPENLRGSTFHPSSLDMLQQAFGAATPLIERGLLAPKVQYRRHGRGRIAEFDFGDIADLTAHPCRLQAEQYKLCQILRDKDGTAIMLAGVLLFTAQAAGVSFDFAEQLTIIIVGLVLSEGSGGIPGYLLPNCNGSQVPCLDLYPV